MPDNAGANSMPNGANSLPCMMTEIELEIETLALPRNAWPLHGPWCTC